MVFDDHNEISLGYNCTLNLNTEILIKDQLPIALSRIQFRLLYLLSKNLGKPVPLGDLTEYGWGNVYSTRADLYVYINRLRRLIEDLPKKPKCLLTVHGYGYILYPRQK